MSVTAKLLRVFLVDKQLRGLQSRLGGAEKFLSDQVKQLGDIDSKRKSLESQLKQAQVKAADAEGEIARLDARMNTIREQMNNAQTNKEYKAFLTEVNTYKAERDRLETSGLEHITRVEDLKKQLAELGTQKGEREGLKRVASDDREKRHSEIKDRVDELKRERESLAKDVPVEMMSILNRLVTQRGDDAMATIEIHDFKRGEFTCGACMMSLPVESVAGLLSNGKLTRCVSCQCILYLDEAAREAAQPAGAKK